MRKPSHKPDGMHLAAQVPLYDLAKRGKISTNEYFERISFTPGEDGGQSWLLPLLEHKGTMTGGYEGDARCFTLESMLTRAHRRLL